MIWTACGISPNSQLR